MGSHLKLRVEKMKECYWIYRKGIIEYCLSIFPERVIAISDEEYGFTMSVVDGFFSFIVKVEGERIQIFFNQIGDIQIVERLKIQKVLNFIKDLNLVVSLGEKHKLLTEEDN